MSATTSGWTYRASEHRWCLELGWQLGRLEFVYNNQSFDSETNALLATTQRELIGKMKTSLADHGFVLHDEARDFESLTGCLIEDLTNRDLRLAGFVLLGDAGIRVSMGQGVADPQKRQEMEELGRSCVRAIPGLPEPTKRAIQDALLARRVDGVNVLEEIAFELMPDDSQSPSDLPLTVLFVAAEPKDQVRLRLDEEVREIQHVLQLAKNRDKFHLEQRMAVRAPDLTQALLDLDPYIVHFSGHGSPKGEICLEAPDGTSMPIPVSALKALFATSNDRLECVVLNACFSEEQAAAISRNVPFVVGMKQEMNDAASIAFALGFYQALGAGRAVPDAFQFGLVQLGLWDLPGALTPQLFSQSAM